MIKTQIQLPDRLCQEAKRVAQEREISFAEVLRRGVEYITRAYRPGFRALGLRTSRAASALAGIADAGSDV
jgi:hypothetical protein